MLDDCRCKNNLINDSESVTRFDLIVQVSMKQRLQVTLIFCECEKIISYLK